MPLDVGVGVGVDCVRGTHPAEFENVDVVDSSFGYLFSLTNIKNLPVLIKMNDIMERLKDVKKWEWWRGAGGGGPPPINKIHNYKPLSRGVDGSVYEINKDKKYVVKIMTNRDAFDMERYVGLKAGIERSAGVRVHAYTTTTTTAASASAFTAARCFYAVLLDHASFGNKAVRFTMPAKDYLAHIKTQPQRREAFDRRFAQKLRAFYTTVQGFHGDLHNQNVVVTLDKRGHLLNIVILDYGRFVPFNNGSNSGLYNLRTMLNIGHRRFEHATRNQHFSYLGVPRRAFKYTHTQNPSASNRNMLHSDIYWKRAYNRLIRNPTLLYRIPINPTK